MVVCGLSLKSLFPCHAASAVQLHCMHIVVIVAVVSLFFHTLSSLYTHIHFDVHGVVAMRQCVDPLAAFYEHVADTHRACVCVYMFCTRELIEVVATDSIYIVGKWRCCCCCCCFFTSSSCICKAFAFCLILFQAFCLGIFYRFSFFSLPF